MQLAPVVAKPLPDDLLPKLAKLEDAVGVKLATAHFEAKEGDVSTDALVPGDVVRNNQSPGAGAVEHPAIQAIRGSFEDAVRAAATMASTSKIRNGTYSGVQPVAVIQAADGAFGIAPLLTPAGRWVMFAPHDQLQRRGAQVVWTREHSALQAIVGDKEWVDMRRVKVGAAVTA